MRQEQSDCIPLIICVGFYLRSLPSSIAFTETFFFTISASVGGDTFQDPPWPPNSKLTAPPQVMRMNISV